MAQRPPGGNHQGRVHPRQFDVTSNLVAGASNVLAVHIFPQPHPGETHEKTIANGTGPNGGVTGLDGPTFLCTIGWDWIPTIRDRDSGLWQDVTLSASGPVVLENPFVTSDLPLPRTDTADLTVQATLRNVTDMSADRHPLRQGRGNRIQADRLPLDRKQRRPSRSRQRRPPRFASKSPVSGGPMVSGRPISTPCA